MTSDADEKIFDEVASFDTGGTKALLLDVLQQRIMAKMRIL